MSEWLASIIETVVLMTVVLVSVGDSPLIPNAAAESMRCIPTEKNEIRARSAICHDGGCSAPGTSKKPLGKSHTPFFL